RTAAGCRAHADSRPTQTRAGSPDRGGEGMIARANGAPVISRQRTMKEYTPRATATLATTLLLVMAPGCSGMPWNQKPELSARTTVVDRNTLTPAQRDKQFTAAHRAGMTHAERHEYGEAMAAFEEASRLRPDSTEALFNLAACYES